ncbi:DNA-binding protein, excisionase family [Mycobacterium sp. JS623]|nr:DNA-binding protein, excisionase family [Mycobacterium sp. JS623]
MSRRYISIAEAAEYLKISDRTVRRLIADGELTGYSIGRSHRMLRVDLDEIDEKLMRPISFHWNDPSAKPRKREGPHVPDRSIAVKGVEESASVKNAIERKPRRQTLFCKCGHGDGAHGMRTTYGPGVDPPNPRFKCWSCECTEFVQDVDRPRRKR